MKKLFVIKKYIYANNASHALRIERTMKADDCWIDEEWKKNAMYPKDVIGFEVNKKDE